VEVNRAPKTGPVREMEEETQMNCRRWSNDDWGSQSYSGYKRGRGARALKKHDQV